MATSSTSSVIQSSRPTARFCAVSGDGFGRCALNVGRPLVSLALALLVVAAQDLPAGLRRRRPNTTACKRRPARIWRHPSGSVGASDVSVRLRGRGSIVGRLTQPSEPPTRSQPTTLGGNSASSSTRGTPNGDAASRILPEFGCTTNADVLIASDAASARVVLGDPGFDPQRDYVAVEVVNEQGGFRTAVPAATSLFDTTDRLARERARHVDDVRRMLALHHLARTSTRIRRVGQ